MKERSGCVYCITNLVNGKQYIGQTIQAPKVRWQEHLRSARGGIDLAVHRAIRKYGTLNFAFRVLLVCPASLLNASEVKLIAKYDTLTPKGYNLTAGGACGHGPLTSKKRAQKKQRLSAAAKRQWANPEARAAMLAALDGKRVLDSNARARIASTLQNTYAKRPELIKAMVERNTGKKASKATREKMRASQQRRRAAEAMHG